MGRRSRRVGCCVLSKCLESNKGVLGFYFVVQALCKARLTDYN